MVKLSTIFQDNAEILYKTAVRSSQTYGISVVFEDLDGMRITQLPDKRDKEGEDKFIERYILCDICKKIYRRVDADGTRHCNVSDRDASWTALAMGLRIPFLFKCHAGLSNFLIPIVIGGTVVGNVFGGQFFISRGEKKQVDADWVRDQTEAIWKRWKDEEWPRESRIDKEYNAHLQCFLLGPESGGYEIPGFVASRNREAIAGGSTEVIPQELISLYKTTIYGVDRWELIEDLAKKIWKENPTPILQSIDKAKNSGVSCPDPSYAEVGRFLNSLSQHTRYTEITKSDKRQNFMTEYIEQMAKYEKYHRTHTKTLESILDIIAKLYSEADTLSRLANERYYLKLYEGLVSHIPEFVENRCRQELEWIRKNIRELVIELGTKESRKMDEHQERIVETNMKFYAVLSNIQDYQNRLNETLTEKLRELVEIRDFKGDHLYEFFNSYAKGLAVLGDIGEEMDRCERVYTAFIYSLLRHKDDVQKAEEGIRKQREMLYVLEGEEREVHRSSIREELEEQEEQEKLRVIQKRRESANTEINGLQNQLTIHSKVVTGIDAHRDSFLHAIYECKKLQEDLRQKTETYFEIINKELESCIESTDETPAIDVFEKILKRAADWPELSSYVKELEDSLRLVSDALDRMKNELSILEETVGIENYEFEKTKDVGSIGIIGVKEWRTNRLKDLNDTLAKIMDLFHKEGFHVRYDTIYFNTGGLAPVHTDIEREQKKWMIERDETGPVSEETEHRIERELKITRKLLSFILGVDENEVVLTDSTTEGIFLTLNAINFQKGDQIITTQSEHDVVRYLLERIKDKQEAQNIELDIKSYPSDQLASKVTKRTKLVIFSDMLFTTGDRLDSRTIIEECRKAYDKAEYDGVHKSQNILFLIDGAQSVGQTAINLNEIGCDFFAMDGHKWLLASEGSGALFVRKEHLKSDDKTVKFTFIKNYMVTHEHHPKDGRTGYYYELATINLSSKIGLKSAIQIIARDGLISLSKNTLGSDKENRDTIAWKILNNAFDEKGNLKDIDVEMSGGINVEAFNGTPLHDLMNTQSENGKVRLKTLNQRKTEELIRRCLERGIIQTRETIKELKNHFWRRFEKLKKDLDSDVGCGVTVKRATKEKNEGGVVGFQLAEKADKEKPRVLSHEIHKNLGDILEREYKILFRVILPPYDPAIRICLHKYNTKTEIDLFFYALQKTISTLGRTLLEST